MSPGRDSREPLSLGQDVEARESTPHERAAEIGGASGESCDASPRNPVDGAMLGLESLRLMSVNHLRVSFSDLDRVALAPDQALALRDQLDARGVPAVILATCNRTELYWQSRGPEDDLAVEDGFETASGISRATELVHREDGENAARHLFRVASGLDSLLVGESEILGQVNDALARFGDDGFVSGVFRGAVRCGRYARVETEIGAGALSVASAAVRRLASGVGDLAERTVMVMGAGSTGLKVARHLHKMGVTKLVLMNRTLERAQAAAPAVGAEAAGLEELPRRLAEVDAIVVASHAPDLLITSAAVSAALARRAGRPLVMLDLSMPRGVDAAVRDLPGVQVHDLSGLEELVSENLERRRAEIPKVEAVIDRELEILKGWARHRVVRPILSELRARAERIRQAELERLGCHETLDSEAVDRLTRRLLERVLAIPATLARDDRHSGLETCRFRCLGLMGEARDESA